MFHPPLTLMDSSSVCFYSEKVRNNYTNSNNSSRDQSPRSSSISSKKSIRSGISSLNLKRIVSRSSRVSSQSSDSTPIILSTPDSDLDSNSSIQSLANQPIKHSETSNTMLSNTDTIVDSDDNNNNKPIETNFDFSPLSHLNNNIPQGDGPIDQSPLINSTQSSLNKLAKMTSVDKDTTTGSIPSNAEDKAKSYASTVIDFFKNVKNTLITLSTNSVNLTLDSIYKLTSSITFSFNKVVTTFKENPLLTYDSAFVTFSALIGTGAYYYHKSLVSSNLTCNHCVNKNVPWEVIAGVSTFLGVFGVGNYLYLKKGQGKK